MKHANLLFTCIALTIWTSVLGQRVAINETGASPHASSILHVQSTTKGLLIPRMTSMQRTTIPSPAIGLMVFDLETSSFWFVNLGGQWTEMRTAANDYFTEGTYGIYTTESGIGVGQSTTASYQKFIGCDSINNVVHLALRNKHALGNSALYLLDEDEGIGGAFEFDNADNHLYIQNGHLGPGGDIIFRTNQVIESDNPSVEVVRIKRLGSVGIGTSSPDAKLHIANNARTIGLWVENTTSTDEDTYGILNDNNCEGTGTRVGIFNRVFGNATSDDIYASYNYALALGHPMDTYAGYFDTDTVGTGTHYGIYTRATGSGDYALYSHSDNGAGWAGYFVGRAYISGRLGIGTDTPEYKIDVASQSSRSLNIESSYTGADSTYGIYNLVNPLGSGVHFGMYSKVEMDPGNTQNAFGIRGQVEPEGTGIHWGVFGRANGDNNIGVEGISTLAGIGVKGTNTNTNGWAGYFDGKTYIEDRLEIRDKIWLKPAGTGSAGEIELYDNDGDKTFTLRAAQSTDNGAQLQMYSDDNDLNVILDAEGSGEGGAIVLADNEGEETIYIRAAQSTTNGAEMLMYNDAGTLTIELDADFNSGKGRVITDELEITGGSDLAEHFEILNTVTPVPGTLVSLDPSGSGKVMPTQSAYDTKVVGVISGANGVSPGMLMGQKTSIADGDFPVALVGRVYVLADASKNSIVPGDLMTSSDRTGYAMSVTKHKRAQGAVIGKAITGLHEGTGYVLILVNLQ